jgi:glycosyltransferase involved in cell wall biosynthesis
MPFSLPLVSVIIVNYNYSRFLKQAADSVFEQTYPNIECIIVDNASTDCSAAVLLDISTQYPGAKMVRRKDNGGQSLASMEGFEASSGEYVVFLDADDYLLASFVETHVFVHLSLRVPVGFSSSDMIQTVDSRIVLGTLAYLSGYVRSGRGISPGLLRRIDESAESGRCQALAHPSKPKSISSNLATPATGCGRRLPAIAFAATRFSFS